MICNEVKKIIQKAANTKAEVKVEYPADSRMGDYATNIAFVLAKKSKKNPRDVANELVKEIASDKKAKKMFSKVEAAGAGFINFTLSQDFLQKQLSNVGLTKSHMGKGKKLNIEFLSANPTGKFHVGNGRVTFFGDALGNVFKRAGFKVTKEYYVNNAKSSNQIQELGKTALGMGEKYLTPYAKAKIEALKSKISKLTGSDPVNLGEAGFLLANEIHKDNKRFLKKIGIHFDVFTEEEKLYTRKLVEKTLAFLKKNGLVYEKDGAQWLKTTQFGDDKDKVIVRADGDYGYYLGDIAYHWDKVRRGFKIIIDIFGADHQGHVGPMKVAMRILGYGGKFDVLVSQLVQAKGGGKFSKREGNIVELAELVDEVGVDAARFFYLAKSLDTQMEFDLDLAKEQSEKNPVYYVQYAHARMASILRRAGYSPPTSPPRPLSLGRRGGVRGGEVSRKQVHPSERNLMTYLLRWPEIIEDTANDYELQRVPTYAYELATVFNQFYRDCKVISDDKKLSEDRLRLVVATQKVLKEVLGTLGISAPEKM